MTGTLELLCGPSGVGKTSSIDGITKSYRWTTRPKRDSEIDSRDYDGTKSTHGYFVSEEEFQDMANKGELVGVHQYPGKNSFYHSSIDGKTGDFLKSEFVGTDEFFYGFNKFDLETALELGEDISEQVVDIDAIDDLSSLFDTKKTLYLGFPEDIKQNLMIRYDVLNNRFNSKFFKALSRSNAVDSELKSYLSRLEDFDDIRFNLYASIDSNAIDYLKKQNEELELEILDHDMNQFLKYVSLREDSPNNYLNYLEKAYDDLELHINHLEDFRKEFANKIPSNLSELKRAFLLNHYIRKIINNPDSPEESLRRAQTSVNELNLFKKFGAHSDRIKEEDFYHLTSFIYDLYDDFRNKSPVRKINVYPGILDLESEFVNQESVGIYLPNLLTSLLDTYPEFKDKSNRLFTNSLMAYSKFILEENNPLFPKRVNKLAKHYKDNYHKAFINSDDNHFSNFYLNKLDEFESQANIFLRNKHLNNLYILFNRGIKKRF
jgi:hypothetical protein